MKTVGRAGCIQDDDRIGSRAFTMSRNLVEGLALKSGSPNLFAVGGGYGFDDGLVGLVDPTSLLFWECRVDQEYGRHPSCTQ